MIVTTEVYAINHPPEPPPFVGAEPRTRTFTFHFVASRFVSTTAIPAAVAPVKKDCTVLHIDGQGDLLSPESAERICQKVKRALAEGV